MESFNITSSTLNSNYEFKNDYVVVNGNFAKDAKTDVLSNISGTAYRKNAQGEQGEYIGNFNGYMRDGEIKYSLSEMSRADSNLVWDAIDSIETYIDGENE